MDLRRFLPVMLVGHLLLPAGLWAQIPVIEEDFNQDPCEQGTLVLNGHATWVSPDAVDCGDPNQDPGVADIPAGRCQGTDPCSLYPGEGYVLVTPAVGNRRGSAWLAERLQWNDFRMRATVELRDGCQGGCSDGMCIVIVGTQDPPGIPSPFPGGGSMGATGLGDVPTLAFEFDTWGGNQQDQGNDNHMGFAWERNGFPNVDWLPMDVFLPLDKGQFPINNRQSHPASSNRWDIEALVQNGIVAFTLENKDIGFPRTRMYTYKIPDYVPFEGYLGVTGATGGGKQNQILHSVEVKQLPPGFCLSPPAIATRKITNTDREDGIPLYKQGDRLVVEIELRDIRTLVADNPSCDRPIEITVTEKLPTGWKATDVEPVPSSNVDELITWKFTGLDIKPQLLSYRTVAATANDRAVFKGQLKETNVPDIDPFEIEGDLIYLPTPFTPDGFLLLWNHLGPLAWSFPGKVGEHGPPGACDANGGADLPVDWIVNEDGSITEANILPLPGMIVRPKYGGNGVDTGARAAGLVVAPGDPETVVRDRSPVWKSGFSPDDTVNHTSAVVNGFNAEDHMTMSCVYVINNTDRAIDTQAGFGSDDSIQILVNDVDITKIDPASPGGLSVCRGFGGPGVEQDTAPVTLQLGENRVLVKVTDGGGPSGFRLRFQNPADPTLPGLQEPEISLSLESTKNRRPGKCARSIAKSAIGLGEEVEVSLNLALKAASDAVLTEVLPSLATAASISDGGTLKGNSIVWELKGVTNKTTSYKIALGNCAGDLTFGQSAFRVGSSEIVVDGPNTIARSYRDDNLGDWASRNVAAEGGSSERFGDHEVQITGEGAGVTSRSDSFRYISIPMKGDFEFGARIDCMDDPGKKGAVGLMVRDSDEAGAANVFLHLGLSATAGGAGTLRVSYRNDLNEAVRPVTIAEPADRVVASLPLYLRMVGTGGKISLQRSADGATYKEVAVREIGNANRNQVNLKDTPLIGLAVTGGGASPTRVLFTGVSGPPFGGTAKITFRRGDADVNKRIDITDAVKLLGYLFLGGPKPECLDAADTDDSGLADISDAVSSLTFQFLGGEAPARPGPTDCGEDVNLEEPDLGCEVDCP